MNRKIMPFMLFIIEVIMYYFICLSLNSLKNFLFKINITQYLLIVNIFIFNKNPPIIYIWTLFTKYLFNMG